MFQEPLRFLKTTNCTRLVEDPRVLAVIARIFYAPELHGLIITNTN